MPLTLQEQANLFLDDLRDSGATNMFGAAPYLVEEFGVTRHEAKNLLLTWMRNFSEENSNG